MKDILIISFENGKWNLYCKSKGQSERDVEAQFSELKIQYNPWDLGFGEDLEHIKKIGEC
jgi:hypothetical protein